MPKATDIIQITAREVSGSNNLLGRLGIVEDVMKGRTVIGTFFDTFGPRMSTLVKQAYEPVGRVDFYTELSDIVGHSIHKLVTDGAVIRGKTQSMRLIKHILSQISRMVDRDKHYPALTKLSGCYTSGRGRSSSMELLAIPIKFVGWTRPKLPDHNYAVFIKASTATTTHILTVVFVDNEEALYEYDGTRINKKLALCSGTKVKTQLGKIVGALLKSTKQNTERKKIERKKAGYEQYIAKTEVKEYAVGKDPAYLYALVKLEGYTSDIGSYISYDECTRTIKNHTFKANRVVELPIDLADPTSDMRSIRHVEDTNIKEAGTQVAASTDTSNDSTGE